MCSRSAPRLPRWQWMPRSPWQAVDCGRTRQTYARRPNAAARLERSNALRAGDDFNGPFAQIGERLEQFWTSIDAIGKDVAQFREHATDDPQQRDRTVIVLDIGGMHQDCKQRTFGISDDVTLATFHLLGHVKAPWTATFRGFHTLAVDNPRRWSGFASLSFAHSPDQSVVDRAPQARTAPFVEVILNRRTGRKVLRQLHAIGSRWPQCRGLRL